MPLPRKREVPPPRPPQPPCAGLRVVEVVAGTSELGLGLAGAVPGMLLAQLGADVTRVVGDAMGIDRDLEWGRVWNRNKTIVRAAEVDLHELINAADVALVYGSDEIIPAEQRESDLIYVHCDGDYALLSEARSGFCSQLAGHRPGPIFVDVHASEIGAAMVITTSVLGLLRERTLTGQGGSAQTSLYDGMLATLGCMIGRSERAAAEIEYYWEHGSTFPNFMYRCSDGELIQVWFGGKGMYAALIEVLGDEPSTEGYYADQMAGRLGDRARRWVDFFATRPREEWITRLRAAGVACEPIFGPGQAYAEPHLAEIGLAVQEDSDILFGTPITISTLGLDTASQARPTRPAGVGPLAGLRVVDFAAYVAGPLAAEVLADLGADVIKVEPCEGEAMRAAAYAIAACQRGKRSIALDISAPETRPVIERLLAGADVVLHNFRVGVAERLGIDAATVARLSPGAVYCHATAFGTHGSRAKFPGNDALMQAVTGFERAIGGEGNDPVAATWIPIDMVGGWLAAVGLLAGLYERAKTGEGQQVATSLLGAGMLLHSGVFLRDGEVVRGPALAADQTGYGPGYRIWRAADEEWFALVVPDAAGWTRLAELTGVDLGAYAPLVHSAVEGALEAAFATAPAHEWITRLRAAGLPVEAVAIMTRDEFRRGILDDPANRAAGRVVEYETRDWGHFEQLGPFVGRGTGGPALMIPGIGEHSVEVLTELGFTPEQIDALLRSKAVRQQ